jgi:hypothetical protein
LISEHFNLLLCLFDNYYWCITNAIFGKRLTVAKKEREFIEAINFVIRQEMRERINSFNRDRCGGFARDADLGRHLFEVGLAYYGYPSPQMQQQAQPQPAFAPQPAPMQSPFPLPPMKVAANGR